VQRDDGDVASDIDDVVHRFLVLVRVCTTAAFTKRPTDRAQEVLPGAHSQGVGTCPQRCSPPPAAYSLADGEPAKPLQKITVSAADFTHPRSGDDLGREP
jgi:hypothetical protein